MRRCFLLCLALLFPGSLFAQKATAIIHPDTLTAPGKTCQIIVSIEGAGGISAPVLRLPAGLELTRTAGQPQVTRMNIRGRRTVRLVWTVVAKRQGQYEIKLPAIPSTTPIPVNAVSLSVLDGKTKNDLGAVAGEPVFATIDIATTNLFRRQIVDTTVKLYSQGSPAYATGLNIPDDIATERSMREVGRAAKVNVSGGQYYVTTYKLRIWPNKFGRVPVQPEITVMVRRVLDNFGLIVDTSRVNIKTTKPAWVTVSKFPEKNRPSSFTEAVGEFYFSATARPAICKVGEPITLRYEINSANSLISPVQPPAMDDTTGFKVYPARLIDSTPGSTGIGGRRVYEQVIEPETVQVTKVPAIRFSYFDPVKRRYVETSKGPFKLTVHPSDKPVYQPQQINPTALTNPSNATASLSPVGISVAAPPPTAPFLLPGGITEAQADQFFYPAREVKAWRRSDDPPFYLRAISAAGTTLYPFLKAQVLPLLAFGLCFVVARSRRKTRGDVAKARRKQAPKAARAGLAAAGRATEPKAFYEGVWQALTEYFGNRLNLSPGEVESRRVQSAFPDQAEEILGLFEAAESSRYGAAPSSDMDGQLKRLRSLIRECEKAKPIG